MKALGDYLKKQYEDRNAAFFLMLVLIPVFAIYYGIRMFSVTPWYDELYTYYYFISNGPIYSAIHWPVPNNHLGYSVVSSFFMIFGNGYFALRIVSVLAAIANLVLIYRIGKYHFCGEFAFAAVLLYASMYQVSVLAVQGRGYTLSTTCMLLATLMLFRIDVDQVTKRRCYVIWAICLAYGLYTVTSSLFWVLPLCVIGGLSLLSQKRIKELLRLILYSVYAAVATIGLYSIVWLAIGSNLLTKDKTSGVFGQGHVQIILHHPIKSLMSGIEYMLASPYIQSVPRQGYMAKLGGWLKTMADLLYGGLAVPLLLLVLLGLIYCAFCLIRQFRDRKVLPLKYLWSSGLAVGMILLLILQSKLPYFRVFSYIGSAIAILLLLMMQDLINYVKDDPDVPHSSGKKRSIALVVLLCSIFSLNLLAGSAYQVQFGDREAAAEEALAVIPREKIEAGDFCVTDVDQQYLVKLNYGIECENTDPNSVSYFLIYRPLLDEQYDPSSNWEQLTDAEVLKQFAEDTAYSVLFENSYYVVMSK